MEWEARVAAAGRRLWTFSYEFDTVRCQRLSGSNSVVECQLPKLDVAGSTPVSRSIFNNLQSRFQPILNPTLQTLR